MMLSIPAAVGIQLLSMFRSSTGSVDSIRPPGDGYSPLPATAATAARRAAASPAATAARTARARPGHAGRDAARHRGPGGRRPGAAEGAAAAGPGAAAGARGGGAETSGPPSWSELRPRRRTVATSGPPSGPGRGPADRASTRRAAPAAGAAARGEQPPRRRQLLAAAQAAGPLARAGVVEQAAPDHHRQHRQRDRAGDARLGGEVDVRQQAVEEGDAGHLGEEDAVPAARSRATTGPAG